jgi:hypothetical protein
VEFAFLLVALYPVFLAALHIPMMVGYFLLKKYGLLKPWHFMAACALVFALGHVGGCFLFFTPGYVLVPAAIGLVLGVICGWTWWYILVKKVGVSEPPGRRDAQITQDPKERGQKHRARIA